MKIKSFFICLTVFLVLQLCINIFYLIWNVVSLVAIASSFPLGKLIFWYIIPCIIRLASSLFYIYAIIFIISRFSDIVSSSRNLIEKIKIRRAESKEKRLAKKQADLEREIAEKQAALDEMKKER